MKSRLKLVIFLIAYFTCFSLLISPSLAAWSTPIKISTSANNVVIPQLTTDTKGYIHAVWEEVDPVDWWAWPNPGIFYSRWDGDIWSAPLKISPDPSTGFADNPAIAADANDLAHIVYADDTYGPSEWASRIAYTKRNADGSWTTPVQLPDPPLAGFEYTWNPKIAVDTVNNLHVSFMATDGYINSIYYSKWEGADWSAPELVSYTEAMDQVIDTQWSTIRGDKLGNVHLIYWSWGQGIFYRQLTGGAWSTPAQVTPDPDVEYMEMTVDDSGNPYVIWFRTQNDSVWVRRTVSGVWQTIELMSENGVRSTWGYPIIGITTTSKNIVAAGWGEEGAGGTVDVAYKYYTAGVGWSAIDKVVTGRISSDNPYLWRDLWDNQHLVWSEEDATGQWNLMYSVVQGKQQTVGTNGGTVVADPGGVTLVTLDIPSGVLSSNTEITILIGPLPESVDPLNVTIPRAYTFGPSGQTFTSPVTAVFTYTTEELAGADPRDLGVYVWDTPSSSWSYKTGQVNTGQKKVTIDLNNFSLFGLSAPKFDASSVSWLPPLSKQGSYEPIVGSTIPIKFTLSYLNGEPMIVGDIQVTISGGSLSEPLIFPFGTEGDDAVRFDEEKEHYILSFHTKTKEYELAPGEYQIRVDLDEEVIGADNPSLLGQTTLTLEEKGKPEEVTPPVKRRPKLSPSPTPTLEPTSTPTPE